MKILKISPNLEIVSPSRFFSWLLSFLSDPTKWICRPPTHQNLGRFESPIFHSTSNFRAFHSFCWSKQCIAKVTKQIAEEAMLSGLLLCINTSWPRWSPNFSPWHVGSTSSPHQMSQDDWTFSRPNPHRSFGINKIYTVIQRYSNHHQAETTQEVPTFLAGDPSACGQLLKVFAGCAHKCPRGRLRLAMSRIDKSLV